LAGNLTIKAVTQPVTFNTTYNGSRVFPMDQSTHYGFSAGATIGRSAFEVSYGVPMVADEVVLQLEAQFIKPAPTG
jgi:polyisoprenoid-binding protein YceI